MQPSTLGIRAIAVLSALSLCILAACTDKERPVKQDDVEDETVPSTTSNEVDARTDSDRSDHVAGQALSADKAAQVMAPIKRVRPDLTISNLRYSHIDGLYKADLGGRPAFLSADGRFNLTGEMYEITDSQLVNLQDVEEREAEQAFAPQRAQMLAAVETGKMIIYPASAETRTHIYVFADVDCGFSRKMHRQLSEMLRRGIEVRYLAFPRAGVESKSAQKWATAWCAAEPTSALTKLMQGEQLAINSRDDNPVAEQYEMARKLGVRSTPTIVLPTGRLVPGVVSIKQLISILKEANLYD